MSQDIGDLKAALSRQSESTHFDIWVFGGPSYSKDINKIDRNAASWAELVLMSSNVMGGSLDHVVVVDQADKQLTNQDIIIFRHPEKRSLREVVESIIPLPPVPRGFARGEPYSAARP